MDEKPVISFDSDYEKDKQLLAQLQDSPDLEDRIVAILMNEEIGCMGFWESYSREKAKAIINVINQGSKPTKREV